MKNVTNQLLGPAVIRDGVSDEAKLEQQRGPYEYSLIGEYVRLLLLLVAIPFLLWFGYSAVRQPISWITLVAACVLLLSLLSKRGIVGFRVFLLVAMTLNVFVAVINPADVWGGRHAPAAPAAATVLTARATFAVYELILLICLTIASVFEIGNLLRKSERLNLFKFLYWSVFLIPLVGYVVGIPVLNQCLAALSGGVSSVDAQGPDWTISKEVLLRSAKFLVFGIFTYFGACIGSFLNVVAHGVPRGESVGLRDSCCPKCKAKIRRIDNLPIFSYLNLSARCRSCQSPIPPRYLIVEILVATIFGSLFLYQLVTGAANVPAVRTVSYSGILWIVLYPKWDIIGIFFFHSFFMSFLVVLSLVEWDRKSQRADAADASTAKRTLRFSIALLLSFLILATIYFPLQPIPAPDFLSWLTGGVPALSQLVKLVFGGVVGAAVAGCFVALARLVERENCITLVPAMTLVGIVLGWQSVLHVSVVFLILLLLVKFVPWIRNSLTLGPTSVLLLAVMIHHPVWKVVFQQFSI
jgi:leader peptidase (prepilin peptidase)/N-methyltransferase